MCQSHLHLGFNKINKLIHFHKQKEKFSFKISPKSFFQTNTKQAEKLYQPFAYQVESTLELSYFYDVVLKLVHPAGQKLFPFFEKISSCRVQVLC